MAGQEGRAPRCAYLSARGRNVSFDPRPVEVPGGLHVGDGPISSVYQEALPALGDGSGGQAAWVLGDHENPSPVSGRWWWSLCPWSASQLHHHSEYALLFVDTLMVSTYYSSLAPQ